MTIFEIHRIIHDTGMIFLLEERGEVMIVFNKVFEIVFGNEEDPRQTCYHGDGDQLLEERDDEEGFGGTDEGGNEGEEGKEGERNTQTSLAFSRHLHLSQHHGIDFDHSGCKGRGVAMMAMSGGEMGVASRRGAKGMVGPNGFFRMGWKGVIFLKRRDGVGSGMGFMRIMGFMRKISFLSIILMVTTHHIVSMIDMTF